MSAVVDENTLFECFRDPKSTDEERALRLLSRYLPRPGQLGYQEVKYLSDQDQFSLLHYACWSGWYDVSRELVDKYQCDPHLKNEWEYTPLHYACWGGNIDIVKFLVVDHHCDSACPAEEGRTPLHCACDSGKLDIVKFLVEECHCDPRVQDKDGDTPLHCACKGKNIDIVKFLIVDHHCDPVCRGQWGRSPLHCACNNGELDIVKLLVEESDCDPFRGKDSILGHTPLHLATRRGNDDVLLFLLSHIPPLKLVNSVIKHYSYSSCQLLQAFMKCRTEYRLESAFKTFVLGNHATGKSTLVKVIEKEITSFFGSFAGQWRNISKSAVVPLTAGIIPVSIKSRRLGQIVIYDMAGHYQYYSSHAALLRSLVSSTTSLFQVVVSLNQEKDEIIRQLQYWNSFVDNCCSSVGRPPTVAVFSHADKVTEDKPDRKSSEIVKGLARSEASSSFSEVVTLDCRKLASGGLTKISKIVAGCCAKFRQAFRFDFAVHLLYAFISSRLADRIACTVSELQSLIRQEQGEDSFALKISDREYLPTNTTELSQHLTTLSDKGQFLFLRNAQKVEDSWVVIDKAVLLSEVNGTIFAPDNFKQHHKIANSTGVVPFSKIREVFAKPKRDPDMVVAFLQHLEFCQEISEAEVSLINREHFRCSSGSEERFFFFPALVSEERPSEAGEAIDTPSYRCGWTLQCSQPHQFLTPQFLHVLLLRLAFSFALAHDSTHESQASPVLVRRCSVWKNGICWLSRKLVETTVEVIEQNTAVSLTISCHTGKEMKCVEHRSQVIKCILQAKELCPAVTMEESLIHPSCLTPPVSGNSLQLFSISELVEALLENESGLVSQPGRKGVEIDQLLYFEPYTCFSADVLRELVAEFKNNSDKLVSEAFLVKVSKTSHTKVDQLKKALGIHSAKFQAALARAPPFQRDHPEYQCKLMFQVWKENTQSPTYRTLRSALDKYSVFCGRNPLELAGVRGAQVPPDQPDLATSPDVQETDEHVFGATVSLDELTVQPDLSDASELSDEDNGSDPPDQSTLPQNSWESVNDSTVLGEDDLRDVILAVTSLAGRWKRFGICLGMRQSALEIIQADNPHSSNDCLSKMLSQWLRQGYKVEKFGEPTWRRLVEAVEKAGGKNLALAQKIARQHPVSDKLAAVGRAQVPSDQSDLATSYDVQEADECVAGATVSLDELTLQPDFRYGDSQQSEEIEHTGSYLPAQSMLPQISGQPTMMDLVRFQGRERRINIPQEIGINYRQFGILLLEDTNVSRVRTMEHKHQRDAEQINMEILEQWVSGSSKQPVTWRTLMEVLRDVELSELASDIGAVKLQTTDDSST